MISDLVLSTRENPDGSVDNIVVDGPSGKPLAGVDVEMWSFDWQRGHQHESTQRTDTDGVAHMSYSPDPRVSQVTFLVRARATTSRSTRNGEPICTGS